MDKYSNMSSRTDLKHRGHVRYLDFDIFSALLQTSSNRCINRVSAMFIFFSHHAPDRE